MAAVDLLVPGSPDTLTGGYLYDRRIFAGLAQLGWQTTTHSLDPAFPAPGAAALEHAGRVIDAIPDDRLIVIDGLVLAGLLPLLPSLVRRLRPIALIHHPLADETGISPEYARQLGAAEKAALKLMPRIVVTSKWTRQRLSDYDVDPLSIAVVEPGVDRQQVAAPRTAAGIRLLTVASITPRKGHALLIEALSGLQQLDWTLRCVGSLDLDRACADRLREQIAHTGLAARISLLGELPQEQLCWEYAAADLFVLPSYLEGFGMALAEAIAHGIPVLSTTAGAIPDTVPPAAGRLIPPGDGQALTAALRELIANPRAREDLRQGAQNAASRMPGWDDAARSFAALLNGYPLP
jgi:glycosyltransferase involved in cell wall biosynthesis